MTDRSSLRATRRATLPSGTLRFIVIVAGIALAAAVAFGLWHVLVGGLINGNPRAGTFGLVLALTAGVSLFIGARIVRRVRRSDSG